MKKVEYKKKLSEKFTNLPFSTHLAMFLSLSLDFCVVMIMYCMLFLCPTCRLLCCHLFYYIKKIAKDLVKMICILCLALFYERYMRNWSKM